MIGHPTGCLCPGCLAERNETAPAPQLPATAVYYAAGFPDYPFPQPTTWVAPTITFTPTPESIELQELRALRRDFDAMKKMVERFIGKGKGKK